MYFNDDVKLLDTERGSYKVEKYDVLAFKMKERVNMTTFYCIFHHALFNSNTQ